MRLTRTTRSDGKTTVRSYIPGASNCIDAGDNSVTLPLVCTPFSSVTNTTVPGFTTSGNRSNESTTAV